MRNQKHDFTRQMKNTNLKDIDRGHSGRMSKNQRSDFGGLAIDITAGDKGRLERFMREELAYYNALVEGFSARIRAFPESIVEFDDVWQKVFAFCAMEGKGLRNIKHVDQLSDRLKPYAGTIFGKDAQSKDLLTERRLMFMDLAASPAMILPDTRRNLAMDMVKFFRIQAQRAIDVPQIVDGEYEADVYKVAPEILQVCDIDRKRHVQIQRSNLVMKWDEANENTLIACPYVASPITVRKINLVEQKGWTHLFIYQEGDKMVRHDSAWYVDVKKLENNYDLKRFDASTYHRSRIFDVAKRKL